MADRMKNNKHREKPMNKQQFIKKPNIKTGILCDFMSNIFNSSLIKMCKVGIARFAKLSWLSCRENGRHDDDWQFAKMSCRESFWFYIIIAVVFIYILQFMTATGKAEGLEEQFFKKPGEYRPIPCLDRPVVSCWSILTHPGKVTDIDTPHSSCCDGPNASMTVPSVRICW